MAFSLLCSRSSSFSTRFYLLALIALVLICFCSHCSSSSFIVPVNDVDEFDEFTNDDGIHYYAPLPHYFDIPQQARMPSKDRFIHILLKSNSMQPNHRHKPHASKRYTPQAFHAMRG